MGKILKIIKLYIIFGLAAALAFSLCGGYRAIVVNRVFGPVTIGEYLLIATAVAVGWLPTAVYLITRGKGIMNFSYATPLITAVTALFFILCINQYIDKKEFFCS